MIESVDRRRVSVDVRTRNTGAAQAVDPAVFWAEDWNAALEAHGARAAADAEHLGLAPLTIRVEGDARTLAPGNCRIDAVEGADAPLVVHLDRDAFTDLVLERRTALGLAVAGRVEGDGAANQLFCRVGSGPALVARRTLRVPLRRRRAARARRQ